MLPSPVRCPSTLREPVSRMHLVFDEEDDEGGKCREVGPDPKPSGGTDGGASRGVIQDSGWDLGETQTNPTS